MAYTDKSTKQPKPPQFRVGYSKFHGSYSCYDQTCGFRGMCSDCKRDRGDHYASEEARLQGEFESSGLSIEEFQNYLRKVTPENELLLTLHEPYTSDCDCFDGCKSCEALSQKHHKSEAERLRREFESSKLEIKEFIPYWNRIQKLVTDRGDLDKRVSGLDAEMKQLEQTRKFLLARATSITRELKIMERERVFRVQNPA
jgi:predicted RNase H-like nuclease (RuvC/YqgF family)